MSLENVEFKNNLDILFKAILELQTHLAQKTSL